MAVDELGVRSNNELPLAAETRPLEAAPLLGAAFYAAFRAPADREWLLGVHRCSFPELCRRFSVTPGEQLKQGVFQQGFDTFADAATAWRARPRQRCGVMMRSRPQAPATPGWLRPTKVCGGRAASK